MLLFNGCAKPEASQTIKLFEDLPLSETKRIEFSNFTVTSTEKESVRSKMVIDTKDIEAIVNYLKTISGTESRQKEKTADFTISLINNTEKAKSYTYSIGVSKNRIYINKYKQDETTKTVYRYTDTKVVEELRKLYNLMNYKEELLMKK